MNVNDELAAIERESDMLRKESMYNRAENAQLKRDLMMSSSSFADNPQKTLIEYETDSKDVLDQIYHFLLSHHIVFDERGERWVPPTSRHAQIFSESGATQLINQLLMYINKSQLSSNLSPEQIEQKMYILGIELADYIYTNYEYLLEYQTAEELYNKYIKDARFQTYDQYELYMYCAELSENEMREKYKYIDVAFVSIVDLIHANLLRAKGGEERSGRRKTTFISQNIGGGMYEQPQQQRSVLRPSTW